VALTTRDKKDVERPLALRWYTFAIKHVDRDSERERHVGGFTLPKSVNELEYNSRPREGITAHEKEDTIKIRNGGEWKDQGGLQA